MQLQALVHHFPLQIGVPQLARRCLFGGQLTFEVPGERPIEMRPADLQLGLEIGEDKAGVLEIEDWLAESLAIPGKFYRIVKRALEAACAPTAIDRRSCGSSLIR